MSTEDTAAGAAGTDTATEFAGLDAIELEARAEEQAREAAQSEASKPSGVPDQVEMWALIPKQLGGILAMALPELRDVYTDAACMQWGAGMAAVAQKYEWDAAEVLAKWAPEVALVTATIPLAVPTYFAVSKRLEAAKAREKAAAAPAAPMKDLNTEPVPAGRQAPGNFSEPH